MVIEYLVLCIGDGQTLATFGAATCEHLTAMLGRHTCAEPMLVAALPIVRLVRPFHPSYPFVRAAPLNDGGPLSASCLKEPTNIGGTLRTRNSATGTPSMVEPLSPPPLWAYIAGLESMDARGDW